MPMQEYLVTVPVTECTGHQCWTVLAVSAADAIECVHDGGGEFVEEEVTVGGVDFDHAEAELNE